MSRLKKKEHHIRSYKIAAQSAGLVVCIFIIFFIAGTGVPLVLKNEENELIPFIPFLILPVSGYIITWYKEITGTIMMTGGGIILLVFFLMKNDIPMGLVYGLPFILAGAVFLVHINKRNQLKRNS